MTVRDYEAFRDKYRNMPRKEALSEEILNRQINTKMSAPESNNTCSNVKR